MQKKILTAGVMHACVKHKVDIVLTGSIRDEGPIPGVTTDVVEAQKIMREKLADVTHVLLLGTVQHSMAVASMLAPTVKTVCVDIDSASVERAVEHQPLQSIGLVTDVEPFCARWPTALRNRTRPRDVIVESMRQLLLARRIITASSTRSTHGEPRARRDKPLVQAQWKASSTRYPARLQGRAHPAANEAPDMVFNLK